MRMDALMNELRNLAFMWITITVLVLLGAMNTFYEYVHWSIRDRYPIVQPENVEYGCIYYNRNCKEMSPAYQVYKKWKKKHE